MEQLRKTFLQYKDVIEHGGVVILCKQTITMENVEIPNGQISCFECCGASVKLDKQKIIIVALYRPPTHQNLDNFFSAFDDTLEIMTQKNNKTPLIVCGDLNIDLLTKCNNCEHLIDITSCYNLTLVNGDPTRITPNTRTLIDHFFTNIESSYISTLTTPSGISDYSEIILIINTLNTLKPKQTKFLTRKFSPSDIASFAADLERLNWDNVFSTKDDSREWFDIFFQSFKHFFDIHFPKTISTRKTHPKPPFPEHIKEEGNYMRRWQRHIHLHGTPDSRKQYVDALLVYNHKLEELELISNTRALNNSTNPGKTAWNIIKTRSPKLTLAHSNNFVLLENNVTINDPKLIANIFSNHFK